MIPLWEYKFIDVDKYAFEQECNMLGNDGWELVSVTALSWKDIYCSFKRRKG